LLVTLGISGGLVPCPTALAILLAAIGDGRVTLGLLSVIVFSLGLTVVLVAIGLVMVSATALAHDHLPGMGLARWARLASGLIVTGLGVYLVVEAFIYQGWWR
jgi:ABC-type nickel/cobalt efflux system permease component RcnA